MTEAKPVRQPWQSPTVRRLDTRKAETGANPVNPEGAFGFGS